MKTNTIDERVETVLRTTFKLDKDQSMNEVGPGLIPQWDSLGHIGLIHAVEEAFELHFSVDEIARIESLESLKEVVRNHVAE